MIGDGTGKRPWVYQAMSSGAFRRLHRISGWILLVFYLALPFLQLGGHPLLRIDLANRKLSFLGQVFTSHDAILVLIGLLFTAIGLGFATALLGRVWCGYACPQTVFLEELVRRIEHWIEGDRGARRKLDEMPWTPKKIGKKALKWSLFALFSFVLSMTFVSLFSDPYELWRFRASPTEWSFVAFFGIALFVDFAWFREQFCNYLCPYARLQGALTDEHSLVIGYEAGRGEPRFIKGKLSMKDVIGRAGCVNCNRCVAVCPQGIDIRNGYQLECIACGHCIDACTEVMGRHNNPTLIHYTTEAKLAGRKSPLVRPRPVLYGGILLFLSIAALVIVVTKGEVDARITRAVGVDFNETAAGEIQNAYVAHVFNNDRDEHEIVLSIRGLDGAQLVVPGRGLTLDPGEDRTTQVFVIAPYDAERGRSTSFDFVFQAGDTEIVRPSIFLQPIRNTP